MVRCASLFSQPISFLIDKNSIGSLLNIEPDVIAKNIIPRTIL